MYNLLFVLRYRSNGKVKTVKTALYTGEDYSELLRIQDRNTNTVLHSVASKRIDGKLFVTITENNVD
jgi:hypothetical protein